MSHYGKLTTILIKIYLELVWISSFWSRCLQYIYLEKLHHPVISNILLPLFMICDEI